MTISANIKCLPLVIIFFVVSIANADEFQKDLFSIKLPPGWMEMPRDVIDSYEEGLAEAAPDLPLQHYDYGFQLESSEYWFEYPYIIIQIKNSGRIPENELEKFEQISLQEEFDEHKDQVSSIMSEIQAGKMIFDKQNRIVWMRIEGNVADIGPIAGLSAMLPTEKGIIQISGYSLKADYPTYDPIFRSIAISTVPATDLLYKPNWTDKVPAVIRGMDWDKVIGKLILWAVIGGIVGLFVYLKERKRK